MTGIRPGARRRLPGPTPDPSDRPSDAGFSLLEVLVSFVIFAVVAGSATAAIVTALRASHDSHQRVDAVHLAQAFLADAQSSPGTVQAESAKTVTATVKNDQFTVSRTIAFSGNNSSCSTAPAGTTFTVSVVVTQVNTNKFLARTDSVVTC